MNLSGKPGPGPFSSIILCSLLVLLGGCASEGDLGRPKYDYWSATARTYLEKARVVAAMREDPSLPLTAPEDALRERWRALRSLSYQGVVMDAAFSRDGDGYARVTGLAEDINVERQFFASFVEAADQVMTIDDIRVRRLKKLKSLEARKQRLLVKKRRRENLVIIREGVREMRRRLKRIRPFMERLSIAAPTVPMDGPEQAFEALNQDVVSFHASIDQRAHSRLAGRDRKPYK